MSREKPLPGLCVPVVVSRVIDGDTVIVSIPGSAFVWRIRLEDCLCPELGQPGGREAANYTSAKLLHAKRILLHLPLPSNPHDLLTNLSFERLIGFLWVDDECLNDVLVETANATRPTPKNT